jgi:hypothetical protein
MFLLIAMLIFSSHKLTKVWQARHRNPTFIHLEKRRSEIRCRSDLVSDVVSLYRDNAVGRMQFV